LTVKNSYIFMIENTDDIEHSYYFDVDNSDIVILSPKEPVKISAGAKRKTVVTLATTKKFDGNEVKDLLIPINIHAYATDAKETIYTDKSSNFAYPSQAYLKAHQ